MEMVSAIVYQLTRNMTIEDIKQSGFDAYFVDQSTGILLLQGINGMVLKVEYGNESNADIRKMMPALFCSAYNLSY